MATITVLVAGTNDPSNSNTLCNAFVEGLQQQGVAVRTFHLKDMRIEHFSLDYYAPDCKDEEDFCTIQEAIESSQGLVIASPIWNFSVPGHLKNFIDRMGSFALDETRSKGTLGGKPFYLLFTGGAPAIAWTALMSKTTSHVQEALKYFGASHIGTHFEEKCTKGKGDFGLVVDGRPESLENVRAQGKEFADVVSAFAKDGTLPAKQRAAGLFASIGKWVLDKVT